MLIKTIKIDFNYLKSNEIISFIYFKNILSLLENFKNEYPDIKQWFYKKVLKGIKTKNRTIILKIYNSKLCGLAILKHNNKEKKICTLYVKENFRNRKLGTELVEQSLYILNCDKPLVTVSSKRLIEFSNLFRKFKFELYAAYPDYYVKGLTEYTFNGFLKKETYKYNLTVLHLNKNYFLTNHSSGRAILPAAEFGR